MVLAGLGSLLLPWMHWVSVGLIVALAATLSSFTYYLLIRGSRVALSDKQIERLDSERRRMEKWGSLALFIAAASPVPDDPLIIYAGFIEHPIPAYLISFFSGKVLVTLAGALIGYTVGGLFASLPIAIGSIALTALLTGYLFKWRTKSEEPDQLHDILDEAI